MVVTVCAGCGDQGVVYRPGCGRECPDVRFPQWAGVAFTQRDLTTEQEEGNFVSLKVNLTADQGFYESIPMKALVLVGGSTTRLSPLPRVSASSFCLSMTSRIVL